MSAARTFVLHGAAAALLALCGCAGRYGADYHPTSSFPPTPTAREAYDACHSEVSNQFIGEDTAAYLGVGMLGPLLFDDGDRKRAATAACMEAHGYTKNS